MRETSVKYSIVVPAYNEEAVLTESYKRLKKVMDETTEPYEIIFVNDGSRDRTPEIAAGICEQDKKTKLINFSRNFGHQIAISAGMDHASGQAVVVIDADLQDPPEIIPRMIEKWKQGYDVVYGKRLKRKGESIFKKVTAALFYRFLKSMTSVTIPVDVGDFRLIDRKVCDTMKLIREKNRFVRGLVSWAGFRQTAVEYIREERFAGETKYPLKRMIRFAFDGITSFSYKPLKIATTLGILCSLGGFIYLVIVLYQALILKMTWPGWASSISITLIFNGIILIILGIIGEYIGRIYDESKNRPLYVIRDSINFPGKEEEIKR
ncbi:MAG: glycosyltransferase family 2 protein [Spirochaetales bacterium]|nr:glycosyltransferase family 2 protein [Spirochaetales bacterium]